MTVRKVLENILVELNTVKAPSVHLEDFLYFLNKGIQEYVNVRYAQFQVSQQLTDDLEWLNSTVNVAVDPVALTCTYTGSFSGVKSITAGTKYNSVFIQAPLPDNYLHLLNCITDVQTNFQYKCSPAGYVHSSGAKRLTNDVGANIMNNVFLQPNYKRTYQLVVDDYVTNERQGSIQVYYGDPNKFSLNKFSIDYLKQPQVLTLTKEERDSIVDTSTVLECPEYVANEIIKTVLKLILENQQNPRLQTSVPINQSIK